MDRNKIVVVLGMHRSGTSAITRGLEVLGIRLGDNLYPPAVDNPKGFWEDRDILGVNEELLACIGSGSERLGLLDWRMPETPEITALGVRAEKLVRQKCDQNRLWGFKDPRTARLLPFWQPILENVGCDVCYVIATRNPISVVQSLCKRNGLDQERTFYLWLEHLIPAISKTTNAKRVVVDYDRLLENPQAQLERIALLLGLSAPEPLSLVTYHEEFLDSGLRHTRYTKKDLECYPNVPAQVIPIYAWLVKLAEDYGVLDAAEINQTFEAVLVQLTNNSPAYWNVTLEDQVSAIKIRERIIGERDEAIQAQAKLIDDGLAGMSAMEKMIRERDETIQAQTGLIDDGMAGMSAMEKMILERDEAIREQTKLIDDNVVRMRDMQEKIREYGEILNGKEQEIRKFQSNIIVRALMFLRLIR